MNVSVSSSDNPAANPTCALKKIYRMEVGQDYSVSIAPNDDSFFVFIRTTSGAATIYTTRRKDPYLLQPDTLYLFPWSVVSRFHCAADEWQVWWCESEISGVPPLPLHKELSIAPFQEETALLQNAMQYLGTAGGQYDALASANFALLVQHWMQQTNTGRIKRLHPAVEKAIELMERDLSENVPIEHIAKQVGLSGARLRQLFTEQTGRSTKDYYLDLKTRRADDLLRMTAMSVSEIGYALGFCDPHHFSKVFSVRKGVSPARYRVETQGN